jgi:hypothetical protein
LQSVTVTADTKEDAIKTVKEWLSKNGNEFIYPENKWEINLRAEGITNNTVIDYLEDSDY